MFTLDTLALPTGPALAIARSGHHVPVAAAAAKLGLPFAEASLFDVLARWDETWPIVREIAERSVGMPELAVHGATVVPQLHAARKVVCAGANYYKHLVEMNVPYVHDAGKPPFLFLKPPTALAGPGRTLPVDPAIEMLDWEVEMVAVIGRRGRDISAARALEHVAGYGIAVDVTARDRLMQPESLFKFDFLAGKGQDGFCPIAPGFLPAAFLPDPQHTQLRLSVNGVTKQDASTSDMIYSVAELIMWASKLVTLEPGDVVLTGSPHGVGYPQRDFLKIGDVMRVELESLAPFEVELFEKPAGI